MSKTKVGKKGHGTAKVSTSRPPVTDSGQATPAGKRPVHKLTPQEQTTWCYWWEPESKLPVEAADFQTRWSGETTYCLLNLNKLPKAGIRKAAQELSARLQTPWVDATEAFERQEG